MTIECVTDKLSDALESIDHIFNCTIESDDNTDVSLYLTPIDDTGKGIMNKYFEINHGDIEEDEITSDTVVYTPIEPGFSLMKALFPEQTDKEIYKLLSDKWSPFAVSKVIIASKPCLKFTIYTSETTRPTNLNDIIFELTKIETIGYETQR